MSRPRPRRCTANRADNQPCQAWSVPGSNPPRCGAHGGGSKRPGAPSGNTNALKHGFYSSDPAAVSIDDAIAGLIDKLERVDALLPGIEDPEHLIRLFELYTQASSRLGRLLRDRRALSGDAADGIAGAIAQALDELGTELGTDLT